MNLEKVYIVANIMGVDCVHLERPSTVDSVFSVRIPNVKLKNDNYFDLRGVSLSTFDDAAKDYLSKIKNKELIRKNEIVLITEEIINATEFVDGVVRTIDGKKTLTKWAVKLEESIKSNPNLFNLLK